MKQFVGACLNFAFNECITHVPSHTVRILFLRLFNRKIHRTASILMHARLLHFWKLEVGPRTVINQYCLLDCRRYVVRIAHDVDIGPYTRIWTLGHDPNSPTHEVKGGDVVINHHVWIASGVTILPNLQLYEGAVVASGAVVSKSVEAKTIVAGLPAKSIGKRASDLAYQLDYKVFLE